MKYFIFVITLSLLATAHASLEEAYQKQQDSVVANINGCTEDRATIELCKAAFLNVQGELQITNLEKVEVKRLPSQSGGPYYCQTLIEANVYYKILNDDRIHLTRASIGHCHFEP